MPAGKGVIDGKAPIRTGNDANAPGQNEPSATFTFLSWRPYIYTIEFGPGTILHTTSLIDDLVQYAGLEPELCFASAHNQKRYIVRDGTMHALPRASPSCC
jgi:hypothetical protein